MQVISTDVNSHEKINIVPIDEETKDNDQQEDVSDKP